MRWRTGRPSAPAGYERFEVGEDAAVERDLAARDLDAGAAVGDDAVWLEVGGVGRAEREHAAVGRVANEQRVGAGRADGLEASFEPLEVLGVARLHLDLDEVALGGPVEEVADGRAGVGLHLADEAGRSRRAPARRRGL